MSWSPDGDRLAYFVRAEKSRTLIVQNVLNQKIEERIDLRMVDDPESPDISPDGRRVVFAALQGGTGDIFIVDLVTKEVINVTKDEFADSGPTWSPDGKSIIYIARVSQNEKLFRLDLDTGTKTQITFGTHDDGAAKFLDADTIVFASTATDPAKPIDPEVARNGNIYNIWTLGLKTGELRQYTDAVGGNLYAVAVNDGERADEDRLRQLLQGQLRAAHARAARADHQGGVGRLRRAGRDHPVPGAAQPHADRGQQEEEGHVRKAVPRWAAARERRRHERRRHLRRLFRDLQRRPGRPAVQPLRRLDLAVPHVVVFVCEPDAPLQLRAAGVLTDDVLLRQSRQHLLRPVVHRRSRPGAGNPNRPWRHRLRHLAVQPLSARRTLRRVHAVQGRVQRPEPAGSLEPVPDCSNSGGNCSAAATSSRSGSPSSRKRRSSASSVRWRAGRCGLDTSTPRAWARAR